MKIQCDVCNGEEASVFCSADEAALCDGCDRRVHHANKLASKHHRFSLLNPSCKDLPRCDVCQERSAFVFCQEDRAILCRECDLPIHTANEHTQKHNRFLLTGVKLSSSSTFFPTTTTSSSIGCDATSDSKMMNNVQPWIKKKGIPVSISVSPELPDPHLTENTSTPSSSKGSDQTAAASERDSTSSISEYLIEMLPGWHVEDFLVSSSAPTHGFKVKTDDLLPFLNIDIVETNLGCFASEDLAIGVPQVHHQAPPLPPPPQINGQKKGTLFKEAKNPNPKFIQRWNDDGFTVPQISPPSTKRSRLTQ